MSGVPQDVVDHCASHPMCRGCPLGTCVAPVTAYPDPRWDQWLDDCTQKARALNQEGQQ